MAKSKKAPCMVSSDQTNTTQEAKEAKANNAFLNIDNNPKQIPTTGATAAYKALEYKENNPAEYTLLASIALEMLARKERLSISRVIGEARISPLFKGTEEHKPFKFNNNLQAALARLLMHDFPQLKGKFETRKSLSDEVLGNDRD